MDFFAPALYLDYSYSDMQKKLFLESNIKYSLQLGKEFKKPVFPFVWHRYSLISGKYAQIKINEKKFNNYIANILNFTFNNCKVDGVIWWNGESSGYAGRKNSKNINDFSDEDLEIIIADEERKIVDDLKTKSLVVALAALGINFFV